MTRVTGLEIVDERGAAVDGDPYGNNVAFRCLECGGPVLAVMVPHQRGSSENNPSECPNCDARSWLEFREAESRIVVHPVAEQHVTLHAEIVAILSEVGERMKTRDVAEEVNRRGRYLKKDGSPVTPFQIHGRTRRYSKLFTRNGQMVGLVEWDSK